MNSLLSFVIFSLFFLCILSIEKTCFDTIKSHSEHYVSCSCDQGIIKGLSISDISELDIICIFNHSDTICTVNNKKESSQLLAVNIDCI